MPPLNSVTWAPALGTTALTATMAVNGLVTGLIVFRILKVFLEVKATSTSVERTLGLTGGTQLRHIIFVIIESGMTLLVIQLVRLVLWVVLSSQFAPPQPLYVAYEYIIIIGEIFNVIIRSVHISFVLLKKITWLGHHINNNFGAGLIKLVLR